MFACAEAGRRYLLAGGLLAVAFSPYGLTVLWHLLTRQSAAPTYLNWPGQGLLVLVSLAALTLLVSQAGWSWAEFGFRLSFKPGTGRAVLRYLLPLLLLEFGVWPRWCRVGRFRPSSCCFSSQPRG